MISVTNRQVSRIFALVAVLVLSATAQATPIDLGIDFRDSTTWGGHGALSYTNGDIAVIANGKRLYRDDVDGYGVMGGEHDEIDRSEVLTFWFAAGFFDNPGNLLTGVLLTDLFPTPDGGTSGEAGWVRLFDEYGGMIAKFFVNAVDYVANGEFYLDFGGAYAPTSVVFTAAVGPNGEYLGSEYSVAGFTTVPEPATIFLLGTGLLLLAARRRRPGHLHARSLS